MAIQKKIDERKREFIKKFGIGGSIFCAGLFLFPKKAQAKVIDNLIQSTSREISYDNSNSSREFTTVQEVLDSIPNIFISSQDADISKMKEKDLWFKYNA